VKIVEVTTETQECIITDLAIQHKKNLPNDFANKFTTEELKLFYDLGIGGRSWRILVGLNEESRVLGGVGISMSGLPRVAAIKVAWKTKRSLIRNLSFFLTRIIDSYLLYRKETADAKILFIFVSEEYRRLGIGRELITMASSKSLIDLFVDTRVNNTAALEMYEASNFVEVRRNRGHILLVRRA